MLDPKSGPIPPTEQDREVFDALVPEDHYLRRTAAAIDFERFRPLMAGCYSPDQGRPAIDPVLLLRIEFLQYQDRLSDARVIAQAQVNVAYREFLGLSLKSNLPDPSSLSYFRGRLGVEGHQRIFEDVLSQAREQGLVKDRLRLKDATHVIADVAIPSAIALVAGTRERLLEAFHPYDVERVEGERGRAEMIRLADAGASAEQRLESRVVHLHEIVNWAEGLHGQLQAGTAEQDAARAGLRRILDLAHKVLQDRADPKAGDRLISLEDSDARFGSHHGFYCGYMLDITMDAQSELITAVNVLAANGDEAADAATLIRQEQNAQENKVEAISGDAALFQGEKLRELTDPEGLDLEVFTPPKKGKQTDCFAVEDFSHHAETETLTCPAGQETSKRVRNPSCSGWMYRFPRATCAACPLRPKCLKKLPKTAGRSVTINDYTAEYEAARLKAQTPEYEKVRKIHPKVERKLNEMVRWHDGRRARVRGHPQVLVQELLIATVVNIKRIVHRFCAELAPQA